MLSGLEPLVLAIASGAPKKSYEGTESDGRDGPFVNSSVSKNWAKKSSSAPFVAEKVKGLRGDEDEDEAVKAEGAEFSMSRLKKSSTVENEGVIESVNILVDVVEWCYLPSLRRRVTSTPRNYPVPIRHYTA